MLPRTTPNAAHAATPTRTRRVLAAAAMVAAACGAAPAISNAAQWRQPVKIATSWDGAPPAARIALGEDLRASVAWQIRRGDAVLVAPLNRWARGPQTRLAATGLGAITRTSAGQTYVSGADPSGRAWVAGSADRWSPHTLARGTGTTAPVVLASGDSATVATAPATGWTTPAVGLRAWTLSAGGQRAAVADPDQALEGVERSGVAAGTDPGRSWARTSSGSLLTVGRGGDTWAETFDDELPQLVQVAPKPSLTVIPGADNLVPTAVDAAGEQLAIAGIDRRTSAGERPSGVPAVSVGTPSAPGSARLIDTEPGPRTIAVDVAAHVGGGATVVWLRAPASGGRRGEGQARWARIDASGGVAEQGALTTASTVRGLRIERAGDRMIAAWVRRSGNRAAVESAELAAAGTVRLPVPQSAGTESRVLLHQLASTGSRAALLYSTPGATSRHELRATILR